MHEGAKAHFYVIFVVRILICVAIDQALKALVDLVKKLIQFRLGMLNKLIGKVAINLRNITKNTVQLVHFAKIGFFVVREVPPQTLLIKGYGGVCTVLSDILSKERVAELVL